MKNVMKVWIAMLYVALMSGCGGGGSIQSDTPTSAGTAVNMVPFKSLYLGTGAAGSQASYVLYGSDNSGNAYTGTFTIVSNGAITFEGQNVTDSQVVVTIKKTSTGNSVTDLFHQYYQTSNNQLYKTTESTGITGVPIAFSNGSGIVLSTPSDTSHVGDSGSFPDIQYSDGTIDSATWQLVSGINGNSILNITTLTTTATAPNTIASTEIDTFYLDSAGNPYKYSMTSTQNGTTLSLSGNKQ